MPALGHDELGHEWLDGTFLKIIDGPSLDHLTVAHQDNLIGEIGGLVQIVGHQHDALFQLRENGFQFTLQCVTGNGIERAQWFVQQQQWRIQHQGTHQGHTLALAAGQLLRIAIKERGWQAHQFAQLG